MHCKRKYMFMKTRTTGVLRVLHVISWIVFLGLCVQTGAMLYSSLVSLFINPEGARNVYMRLDLSALRAYSVARFGVLLAFMIVMSGLKAYMFYYIIRLFLKANLAHPFSEQVGAIIVTLGYLNLAAGIIGMAANVYFDSLVNKGISIAGAYRYLSGGGEFLFLAAVVFVISQVFRRGLELQTENELTV